MPEGPGGTVCLRLDIERLQEQEVRHSPEVSKLFGDGDDMITLLAKSDTPMAQLAVEIIERDGSRWIAVSELTNTWRRVGLPLAARFGIGDSVPKEKRGGKGDRLRAAQAVRICSVSGFAAMVGGCAVAGRCGVSTRSVGRSESCVTLPQTFRSKVFTRVTKRMW